MAAVVRYSEWPDKDAHWRAVSHIQTLLVGIIPDHTLADVTKLDHFGGTLSQIEWHEHCCTATRPLQAVQIHALTGAKVGILLPPGDKPGTLDTSAILPNASVLKLPHQSSKISNRKIVVYWDKNARLDPS